MDTIYTVSQINNSADYLLQKKYTGISVKGEISSLKVSPSRHAYFTLKDDSSELPCVMFKAYYSKFSDIINIGDELELEGTISLYKPRGQYQFKVTTAKEIGKGNFWLQYEKLKKKLMNEGLFSNNEKKYIPSYLKKIVLVTSNSGAVKTDIINICRKRCSYQDIYIYPVSVQGDLAAGEMIEAINFINSQFECDVIILARGGGSIEDLWPFNDEELARTIFSSKIPIISAVGHEVDYTISDFVSDKRASTPSDAAEIISIDQEELLQQLDGLYQRLNNSINNNIDTRKEKLSTYVNNKIIKDPMEAINVLRDKIININEKINSRINFNYKELRLNITKYESSLLNLNPKNVLKRGYSFLLNQERKPLTSLSAIDVGEKMITVLKDGEIISEVMKKNVNKKEK